MSNKQSKTLNITNGDSAVEMMKQAGIAGDFLPWRDVLHEGPVPASLSLEELSKVRAEFISGRGWGDAETIKQDFIDRDNQLKSYQDYEKVILWFEHDLYDQLQIIQILDWFNKNGGSDTNLNMICTKNYLGMTTPEEMKGLVQYEALITKTQLTLASKAWSAFCEDTPNQWADLLNKDTSVLPFLEGAILRQLEEFPDCKTGLSRTAYQALNIFSQGETRCGNVFEEYNKTEERRFLGDLSFWNILDEMAKANPPLLALKDGSSLRETVKQTDDLVITPLGKDILKGRTSLLEYYEIDRWIGGTHLNKDNLWCWDAGTKLLTNSTKS
jgi:hypothetical protein